jgi:hypothetical protein
MKTRDAGRGVADPAPESSRKSRRVAALAKRPREENEAPKVVGPLAVAASEQQWPPVASNEDEHLRGMKIAHILDSDSGGDEEWNAVIPSCRVPSHLLTCLLTCSLVLPGLEGCAGCCAKACTEEEEGWLRHCAA